MAKEYYAQSYSVAGQNTSLNQAPLIGSKKNISVSISYLVFCHGAKMVIPKEHTELSFLNGWSQFT